MKVLREKYLLKRMAAGLVPSAVLNRPKQPYRAPEGKAFLGPEPPEYVAELLDSGRVAGDGVFRPAAVQTLIEKFRRGYAIGAKDNSALVGILSTQLLIDQFINHS
jgi:asparagine synthase (glutamine-hydrolysing)